MQKIGKIFSGILLFFVMFSCSEYDKVLKNKDVTVRYDYALGYFQKQKYSKAIGLFEQMLPELKGTTLGEESLFMLAQAYFYRKDYVIASAYFKKYYTLYPQGKSAEEARYYSGYSLYENAPDARLDQSETYKAIKELRDYLELYPRGSKAKEVEQLMFQLQEVLAKKAFLNVELYYKLGNYRGNNYRSAIITAENALKDYPFTNYKQEFSIYILRSKHEIAKQSVEKKKVDRYRDVIDEYYSFKIDFPHSEYLDEAKTIFNKASKFIDKIKKKEER